MCHKHVFVSAKNHHKSTKQTFDPKVEGIISGTQWLRYTSPKVQLFEVEHVAKLDVTKGYKRYPSATS